MKFTKMQGIGNDYIYVNCFEEKVENPSALSVRLSVSTVRTSFRAMPRS